MKEIDAAQLQNHFGALLAKVSGQKAGILIHRDGQPVAALIDAGLLTRYMQTRFDALSRRIGQAYADVPEEEGMAEIAQVCSRVRHKTKRTG